METRASHLAVGAFVLLLTLALAAVAVWLAALGREGDATLYEVAFAGSVSGLQDGSGVYYRGVPVGRVEAIRIDPDNVDRVLARIGVDPTTPIKTDTKAELALQGVTGLSNIQLTGGSNASPLLAEVAESDPPVIEAGPSAIEQVFKSGPELLSEAVAVLARLGALASEANVEAVSAAIADVRSLTGTLAGKRDQLTTLIDDGAGAMTAAKQTANELDNTLQEVRGLAGELRQTLTGVRSGGGETIAELQATAAAFRGLAEEATATLDGLERPIEDFSQSGLYDFSQMVRELRNLIASLTRVSTEIERDPSGFLLGGNRRGFEAR